MTTMRTCRSPEPPFDWCQCFAVFIPDELRGAAAWRFYERVRDWWQAALRQESDMLEPGALLRRHRFRVQFGEDGGILTVEGAAFLSDDGACEGMLDQIARDGVRMCTPIWNGVNALGSGNLTDEGLSGFGRSMVRELESREIAIDVSHLNDAGFKDVCEVAERPFAASHSNARAVAPSAQLGRLATARDRRLRRCRRIELLQGFPHRSAR